MLISAAHVKQLAHELGFDLVGITPASPSPWLAEYERWLAAGMHGAMRWLERPDGRERRRNLNALLPQARSIVCVGLNYHRPPTPPELHADPSRGQIAAYGCAPDYHRLLSARLEKLAQSAGFAPHQRRIYVDTGAILERSHAWQAGLGFIGRHTGLIHPQHGGDFFLGELVTIEEFDVYDHPGPPTRCGRCRRCLTACPTGALVRPYVLDARRCIAYLTIEHPDWIATELRPLMGNHVFGCEVCRQVCPWQRLATPTAEAAWCSIRNADIAPPLAELLNLDEPAFTARYSGTPLQRLGRVRLVRNACIAAGNSGLATLLLVVERLLADTHPVVRGHAAWALAQLAGTRATDQLRHRWEVEVDESVRNELAQALETLQAPHSKPR